MGASGTTRIYREVSSPRTQAEKFHGTILVHTGRGARVSMWRCFPVGSFFKRQRVGVRRPWRRDRVIEARSGGPTRSWLLLLSRPAYRATRRIVGKPNFRHLGLWSTPMCRPLIPRVGIGYSMDFSVTGLNLPSASWFVMLNRTVWLRSITASCPLA